MATTALKAFTTQTPGEKSGDHNGPGPYNPDFLTAAGLWCASTSVFGSVIALNVGVLSGLYLRPRTFAFFVVPYLAYTSWFPYELKDGAAWSWFRTNFFGNVAIRKFLNLRFLVHPELSKEDEKPDGQVIMALFPHGVNADFRPAMDNVLYKAVPNLFPKIRTLAASVLFRIPLFRELMLWSGAVDASRPVAEGCLQNKRSLVVCPGGQAEQMITIRNRERVFLSKRKGFIRLALEYNVPVVPGYAFGCSDYYYTSSLFLDLRQQILKQTGMAFLFCAGYAGHPLCPRAIETTVAFGAPLRFRKNPDISEEENIDAAHAQFVQALVELFDEHKDSLGYGGRELEIV